MIRRVVRQRLFLGSTIEEIEVKIKKFLEDEAICVGNYVSSQLFKLGNVYQYIFTYAELVDDAVN
jgi:hypothetical protein